MLQAACGLFDDLQAYKELCTYEQQNLQPPSGLHQSALRNTAALDGLLKQQLMQQDTQTGRQTSADLIAAADELAHFAPDTVKLDLLRHSHALQQQDYLSAVDTLYKYFDHSTGAALPLLCRAGMYVRLQVVVLLVRQHKWL